MLVIDPDTCIDCEACVPACPVNAIWPDHELPEAYASWKPFNAEWAKKGTNCTEGKDPLPTARLLDEIQAAEKAKGLAVTEPSKAS
jgi:ferredoxin